LGLNFNPDIELKHHLETTLASAQKEIADAPRVTVTDRASEREQVTASSLSSLVDESCRGSKRSVETRVRLRE